MESIILCTIFGVFIMSSFYLGFKIGSSKEAKEVRVPIKKIIKKEKIKQSKEEEQLSKVLNNIENYNGTSLGQEVIK